MNLACGVVEKFGAKTVVLFNLEPSLKRANFNRYWNRRRLARRRLLAPNVVHCISPIWSLPAHGGQRPEAAFHDAGQSGVQLLEPRKVTEKSGRLAAREGSEAVTLILCLLSIKRSFHRARIYAP